MTSTYVYGPDGSRLKKSVRTPAGVQETLYLGADVERGPDGIWSKYPHPEVRLSDVGVARQVMTLHKDHLGSVRAVTDGYASLKKSSSYAPYGQPTASGPDREPKGFLGERFDGETGLLYLNARYYDPVLGRFLSPDSLDPILPGVGTNRYAYSLNNPTNFRDPTGYYAADPSSEADFDNNGYGDVGFNGPLSGTAPEKSESSPESGDRKADAGATYNDVKEATTKLDPKKEEEEDQARQYANDVRNQFRNIEGFRSKDLISGAGSGGGGGWRGSAPSAGSRPANLSPEGAGRSGAFNAAKQDAGIPRSAQPDSVGPNLDRQGNVQPGRTYNYSGKDLYGNTIPGTEKKIRDDAAGDFYGPGDPQNRGPHFNYEKGHYDY